MEISTENVLFNNSEINAIWNNDHNNHIEQNEISNNFDNCLPDSYKYIDEKALRMMAKMGFKNGEGLGQNKQGVINSLDISSNLGRRGLGHVVHGLEPAKLTWDSTEEVIEIEEQISWLENLDSETENCKYIENNNLTSWLNIREPKLSIADETQYCDPVLLQKVLKAKEVFDELDPVELCKARSRANPFETIRSAFFMNRAALKMANIDAVTGFLFTDVDRQVEHKQTDNPYYFADICAGPGGFSEYVLWRKNWGFKGFGMTLRGEHDFKLYESTCAPVETFEAFYGVLDNGDIYYPDNIKQFCSNVKNETIGLGVHFVMADGGFSVEGQENIQEVLSKRLYVCQCLTALSALRTDGHFVVKMFDLFTPFSVGLLFLMYHCFHKISIIKPNSSRPANSERYFVCSRLKNNKNTENIRSYLNMTVQTLWDLQNTPSTELDVYELVPSHIIQNDQDFCQYIIQSNNRLAKKQIVGLSKLAIFCRDPSLFEPRQEELRSRCLQFWRVPDKLKIPLSHLTTDDLLPPTAFTNNFIFAKDVNCFQELNNELGRPENWHCMFVGSGRKCNLCNIYVGLGNNRVYRYQTKKWVRVKCVKLIRGTVLFGELVKEYSSRDNQAYRRSLHVIDAVRLGDTSLADLPYVERLDLIKIYCQAINCETKCDTATIRIKNTHPLLKLQINSLPTKLDNGEWLAAITTYKNDKKYYITNSMMFLQIDSSQNFYSTLSSRLVINLTNENDNNLSNSLWHNITIFLQKKYFRNT